MARKLTHDEWINKYKDNIDDSLELLSKYDGTKNKIQVRCKFCGKIYYTLPSVLVNGCKCKHCSLTKTNEQFVEELSSINKNILPLEKYRSDGTPILVKCLICGHEWKAIPTHLLKNHGCPQCARKLVGLKKRKNLNDFLLDLKKKNPTVAYIDGFEKMHSKVTFKSKICGHTWKSSDLHNVKLYNLDIESGYNGIKINGWINNYQNIIVSYFKGIGVYIGRSDNTFNTFYINGCRKEGLYISSSNNRIDNIKILSCGENSDSSCFFKGNRNTISNVEIQDIYNKCAIFENFNNNILNINLDGIRTHITDDASIVLAEFVNCSRNVINLISSKYGSSVNDSSKDDIISLNSNCNTNSLILSSLKVALQDGGVKNNITVLKNDIVSYNIDKILTLEETYSAKKPTAINYVKCTNVSNEYSDAMYAFKNNGDVNYSGPRFTLKEKQKLFCVVVLSSNTAYNEQTQATLMLTDQQDNMNHTKSIGNLENNQVLTLIGADDASLLPWAVLNNVMNSSTITKIKYIGFFDFKNYSAIMSDIIN